MAFQLGSGHRLYLGYSDATTPVVIDVLMKADGTENGTGTSVADFTLNTDLFLADQIKDVNVGGTNNTVDVTTRQTARQGFSANLIATSDATTTVQFTYEPRGGTLGAWTNRLDLAVLFYCFTTKSPIFAIDMDGPIGGTLPSGQVGLQGLGGNFTVGFSTPKEVQGQVVVDVEFALESFAQIVYTQDNSLSTVRALVDP